MTSSLFAYIFLIHVFQNANFSVGPFGVDDRFKWAGQFLDRYFGFCFVVIGGAGKETNNETKVRYLTCDE